MLQITSKHKIFLGVQSIDFRKGIDGIIALCQKQCQMNPLSGHFFIFRNRKGNALKILTYDAQGYWLCQKRLSTGRFKGWPDSRHTVLSLTPAQLHVLLYNGNPSHVNTAPLWRPIDSS
jgi:transposase